MTILCDKCQFMKKYMTGNKEKVKDLYFIEEDKLDIQEGLYMFYKCEKKQEAVKDPTNCEDFEPLKISSRDNRQSCDTGFENIFSTLSKFGGNWGKK
tara:strand:+ start:459 stop:749 length:291 start_codon:yes stop_codon:yes gene_type:complete